MQKTQRLQTAKCGKASPGCEPPKKTYGLLQKIQAIYFKIQGTYFKISALYFSQKIIFDYQQLTKTYLSSTYKCNFLGADNKQ